MKKLPQSKKDRIIALIRKGFKNGRIAKIIRTSYDYVACVRSDLRMGWRKTLRNGVSKRIYRCKQAITLAEAYNHGKEWTLLEISLFREINGRKSVKDCALAFGRTYTAVRSAARRFFEKE